tara:strand:+ start:3016 stop:3276 length:261 start_codon:yes stop_codon:yes gene_type:complete
MNKGNEYIDLQTYKEELKILREHNDDHILQSELEDSIKEIEEEYEVNVSGCFTVVAESQEDADRFIRNQLQDGVCSYTSSLEVGDE